MFSFEGRATRLGFLGWWLAGVAAMAGVVLAGVSLTGVSLTAGAWEESALLVTFVVAIMAYVPIVVPAGVRRLHDLGWPPGLALLLVVPGAWVLMLLLLLVVPGQTRRNAHGPAKAARAGMA